MRSAWLLLTAGSLAAAVTTSLVALAISLFLGGMGGASTNTASGRVVVGWFPPTAAGRRWASGRPRSRSASAWQPCSCPTSSRPTGCGRRSGRRGHLRRRPACWRAADRRSAAPTRAEAAELGHLDNPYRGDCRLWRIHAASMLLVVPQFTVWTFTLVWLIDEKGWSTLDASLLVAATQVLGAAGRIGAGCGPTASAAGCAPCGRSLSARP